MSHMAHSLKKSFRVYDFCFAPCFTKRIELLPLLYAEVTSAGAMSTPPSVLVVVATTVVVVTVVSSPGQSREMCPGWEHL